MKKILFSILLVVVMSTPAFALFTNGGFESGDYSGWTVTYGSASVNTNSPDWTVTRSGQPAPSIVSTSTYPNAAKYVQKDINPYNGNYMVQINDLIGNYHATKISQTATIAAGDIGDTLYVNWGVILEDPNHPIVDLPYFNIKILKGLTVLDSFSANSDQAALSWEQLPGLGWGSRPLYYKTGQYTYNLGGGFAVGDQITIEMFVADCGQGGHGALAFLDGIGTDYVPPPQGVPEPASLLLLGLGLAGVAALRRRK